MTDLCQSCGACCATSRDWPRFTLEDDETIARIPQRYVNAADTGMRCEAERCTALSGRIGEMTACVVYELRPLVCRECQPGDPECGIARRAYGMGDVSV